MIKLFKRVIKFLTEDIWQKKDSEYDTQLKRFSAKQLKVLIYTGQSYLADQLVVRCAALTFYTLMSLVPIAAIIFGIAKGFMFETRIEDYLHDKFPQYNGLIDQLTVFANAMLERTKGGADRLYRFYHLALGRGARVQQHRTDVQPHLGGS